MANANFIEGEGIQISGIQLTCHEGSSVAGIENAFIHAPVQLPELLSSKLTPKAVELTGATLVVTRNRHGEWNLQETITHLGKLGNPNQAPVPVIIRDSKIQIVDRMQTPPRRYEFTQLDFQTNPLDNEPNKFAAAGSIRGFRNGQFSFLYEPLIDGAELKFRLAKLPINQATVSLLPPSAKPDEIRSLVGMISGEGSIRIRHGVLQTDSLTFDGQLSSGSLDHVKSPHLISHCQGPFEIRNNQATGEISGQLGTIGQYGRFSSRIDIALPPKSFRWAATGTVEHLVIDSRLPQYFGPAIQKFFVDFSPKGLVDVDFELAGDDSGFSKKLSSQLVDMSFNFIKFPYPVAHATGTARVVDDEAWFDLYATEQGQPLRLKGYVKGKGPTATLQVDFWNDGPLPIDKKLKNAVSANPVVAKNLFEFRPEGWFQVYGQLRKKSEERRGILDYDVQLIEGKALHVGFEYPIHDIHGLVQVRDGRVTVNEVKGKNGDASVTCNGTWSMQSGLDVEFDAYQVPLNQELADALPPEVKQAWDAIRPAGQAHYVHVDLTSSRTSPINVVVESNLADPAQRNSAQVSIHPYWFPYKINQIDGRVFVGNGQVRMNIAKGYHKETWISCLGNGTYDTEQWALTLSDMMVGSLVSDDDLLNAVPPSLREALQGLNYQGSLSGFGTVAMRGSSSTPISPLPSQNETAASVSPQQNSGFEMDWNVRLDMDRGQFNVGLLAENVFGSVSLTGNYSGQNVRSEGTISLDSLHWQDMQFTKISGPLWIENDRVAIGSMASPIGSETTPLSLTGNLFGGTVRLDGQSWSENEDRFFVQAAISNLDVKRAGQQMAPSLHDVGGLANVVFRVGGGETTESMQGEGIFQLRNANIYELPVVLSMLKMMKTRRRDRTAFDASNADFTIRGDAININKIELLGDAISLVGKGEMNMDHDVNMDFYTVAGRNRFHIPILSDLAKASSQQILWLKVDGSLENPQVHSEILPGLNESVRQLFQTEDSNQSRLERAQSRDRNWR